MRFGTVDPFGVVVGLHVAAFHRRPGDHMRALLAIDLAGMRRISMIEGIAVEVLGLRRQVIAHRCGQIEIVAIRHVTVVPAPLLVGARWAVLRDSHCPKSPSRQCVPSESRNSLLMKRVEKDAKACKLICAGGDRCEQLRLRVAPYSTAGAPSCRLAPHSYRIA